MIKHKSSKVNRETIPYWRRRVKKQYSPKQCNTLFLITIFILMPLMLQAKEFDFYVALAGRRKHDLYAVKTEKSEQGSSEIQTVQSEFDSYTIQTGSFSTIETAEKQFNSLVENMDEKGLEHLRIEKIGKYYAVRLGKFKDRFTAKNYIKSVKPLLSGSIVIRANIHDERLINIYTKHIVTKDAAGSINPLHHETPEETKDTEKNPVEPLPAVEPAETENVELFKKPAPADEKSFIEKVKGRVYVSDYYSVDGEDYSFHILTARLNVYKLEEKKPGIFFEFDGRARKRIFSGDLRANVPEYKISEAWLGYVFPGRKWKAIAGRQYINQLYNTYLDGLNVNYSFREGLGIGVFGGLAPDKYDDSFSTKFRSVGIYGFLDRTDHKISLGYENLTYEGETDREYFSIRAYSKLSKKFRLNALSSVTKNQITNKLEMENANFNLLYSHSRKLRFNVFFNYYRTIKYFESSKYYFEFSDLNDSYFRDDNSQIRTGARVDYKIMKGLKIYTSAAYQKRKLDNEDAIRFTGGIRKYDIYGFDLSARYTYLDGYSSKSSEYNIELYRNIMKKFDVSLYISREEEKLNLENAFTSGGFTYGGSLYWPITKKIFLSMFVERIDEEDYKNTSLFSQLGYKF